MCVGVCSLLSLIRKQFLQCRMRVYDNNVLVPSFRPACEAPGSLWSNSLLGVQTCWWQLRVSERGQNLQGSCVRDGGFKIQWVISLCNFCALVSVTALSGLEFTRVKKVYVKTMQVGLVRKKTNQKDDFWPVCTWASLNPHWPHNSPRYDIKLDCNINPVYIMSSLLNDLVPIMNKMHHLLRDKLRPLHTANSTSYVGCSCCCPCFCVLMQEKGIIWRGSSRYNRQLRRRQKRPEEARKSQRHAKNALLPQFCQTTGHSLVCHSFLYNSIQLTLDIVSIPNF